MSNGIIIKTILVVMMLFAAYSHYANKDKSDSGQQQNVLRVVTGVVRDEKGNCVAGATVSILPWIAEDTVTDS